MSGIEGHDMQPVDGGDNGAQDQVDPKDQNAQPQSPDAAGADGRGADPEIEGDRGADGDQVPGEDQGAEADAEIVDDGGAVDGLTPESISEMVTKSVEEAMAKNAPQQQPPQLTEEQWAAKEQEVGVPRGAIQFFTSQAMKVYNTLTQQMEARFAKFEKADQLRSLSRAKGYEDAMRYPKFVDQFLSKYKPEHHANPELLKMAVVFARGMASKANVQRARVETERGRRIGSVARPASPGSSAGASRRPGGQVARPLTPAQKQAAGMMPGGETEYRKWMVKTNKVTGV